MKLREVENLLAFLKACGVAPQLTEGSPAVWMEFLATYPVTDVMQAARNLVSTQQWVKIADLLGEVRRIRDARIETSGILERAPHVDPDDVPAYLDAVRRQRQVAADGAPPLRALPPGGTS